MKQLICGMLASALLLAAVPVQAEPDDFADIVASDRRLEENKAQDGPRHPATILDFVQFGEGEIVADFLLGNAYFAEMIAEIVGRDGRVYAMNPPGFHDTAKWAGITRRHSNLRPIVAEMPYQQLAPSSVDVIFTHMTFHDLYWESEQFKFPRLDVPSVLANWHAALTPGGEVIIIDHAGPAGDTRDIVARLHRIDRDSAVAAMEEAGFVLVDENDALLNETDDPEVLVFDPSVQGKTSRFMLKFRKR